MALDRKSVHNTPDGPADGAFSITTSDANDLERHIRGIYVGVAGNIQINTLDGRTVIIVGAVAGSVLPIGAIRVWTTNTTASSLLGLY